MPFSNTDIYRFPEIKPIPILITNIVCRSRGRITPPGYRSVVLSLTVSQRTVQNLAVRLFFFISLKEKLSVKSSKVVGS